MRQTQARQPWFLLTCRPSGRTSTRTSRVTSSRRGRRPTTPSCRPRASPRYSPRTASVSKGGGGGGRGQSVEFCYLCNRKNGSLSPIRNWSLITGRWEGGGAIKWENRPPPPPPPKKKKKKRGKNFRAHPPPPFLHLWIFCTCLCYR